MPDLSDTKRKVIEKAKTLRREGKNYRYFSVDGEIWECYQAEYLPDIGERAWFSMPITIFVMDKLMFKPEIDILVNGWQPIETCPESCRGEYPKYVLFYNGYHIGVGFCYPSEDGDGGTLYLDEIDEIVTPRPTHWMPPPLPPGNDAALSREEKS